jgi:SNF2 family DNA or RNA helicase
MKLQNPAKVTSVIPTAKVVTIRGQRITVVPHRVEEVRVLANIGIKAPSPIYYNYDWPGRYTPYDHQKKTSGFLTMFAKAIVLNQIGTGKTNSALWAADFLMREGIIKKVLIISPLSTLERVWGDTIFMDFHHRTFKILHGTKAKRLKLVNEEADFYVVNHAGFPIVSDELMGKVDLIIVDEATEYRNAQTKRFKHFRKWLDRNPQVFLWLMTGTPTPNEPTDAWALARLIDSAHLTKTFTGFKDLTMRKLGMYRWIPKAEAPEIVKHVLQPSVCFSREDCLDLPDTVVQQRQVDLTAEQKKLYSAMMKQFTSEAATGTIHAVNEAAKVGKLVQIACGVAYGDQGKLIEIDCKPRIALVEELIEQAGEKVIIFVPLTGTLNMLVTRLSKRWSVAYVDGSVSSGKRNKIFQDFQEAEHPEVLIAHPGTMAHGLTLTSASTIIWYGPINSNDQYVQANGRVERIGKRTVSNVIQIVSTPLEEKMYKRLENKQKLQGLLLDLIQQETD